MAKMAVENMEMIEPQAKCVKNFSDFCEAYFKRTVFSAECASWYKSCPLGATLEERRNDRVTALWPGSSISAVKALERPR